MTGFNITTICTKSTQQVQGTCLGFIDRVEGVVTPVEAITFVIAGLSVVLILSQIVDCKLLMKKKKSQYQEMEIKNPESELSVVPPPAPPQKNVVIRVNLIGVSMTVLYLSMLAGLTIDMGRRNATPQNCEAVTKYVKELCYQILNTTWHEVIPGAL